MPADFTTPGQTAFTVRYGLAGASLITQTATDLAPPAFFSGRLRSIIVTRSGQLADYAQATRILEPHPLSKQISQDLLGYGGRAHPAQTRFQRFQPRQSDVN